MDRRTFLHLATTSALAAATGNAGSAEQRRPTGLPPLAADLNSAALPQHRWRTVININREWKFILGDHPGAQTSDFADASWNAVGLPHSFSLPYFRGNEFYVGYGWYRKRVAIPHQWRGRRVLLEFEAAFQDAEVFVNGRRVGGHKGGYTSFAIDITSAVQPGQNVLAIRLNNLWNAELAPRAGDHIFDGGLYRNVFLVAIAPMHIPFEGVRVSTPRVSEAMAQVRVQTRVVNTGATAANCTVLTAIINPDGGHILNMRSRAIIPAGGERRFDQTSREIRSPRLWHPDHPAMYRVETTILDGEKPVDDAVNPLGFRWFAWTAEKGFSLNGEHLWLRGANVHQDHAGWASGITDAGAWRDVQMIKEAGFNFIRTSHYPHSRAFMQACDAMGILVWSEMCFWGCGGSGPEGTWGASAYPVKPDHWRGFESSCLAQLREMIAMHANHPCVIAWSMCNEVFFTNGKVFDRMKHLLTEMVRLSHALDPTRPAGIGGAQRGGVDKLGDVAGYNGDGALLYLNPRFPNMVTEYGSVIARRPGNYNPNFGQLQATQFPWRSGAAIWCGFDYGTWIGGTGEMGIVDYFRLPKRSWYWYRSRYARVPPPRWPRDGTPARLQLHADKTIIHGTDATDDCQLVVTILDAAGMPISKSPPVTLAIESGPGEFPTGPEIVFASDSDIWIGDGQAAVEFRSYYAGRTVIRATSPGLAPARLVITTNGEPQYIADQTPSVAMRPYIRSPQPNQNTYLKLAAGLVDRALYRPTAASSSKPGHPSENIDDGNGATSWLAARNAPTQWCQVDLEGEYPLHSVRITFPAKGLYRFRVLVSRDGTRWKPALKVTEQEAIDGACRCALRPKTHGRYVRIVLDAVGPKLDYGVAELAVFTPG